MIDEVFQASELVEPYRVAPSIDLEENLNFHVFDDILVDVDTEELNAGLLLVASNSIGSPRFSLTGVGLNVPLPFRGVVSNFPVGLPFLMRSIMLCLFCFAIAHLVMSRVVLRLSVSPVSQASCSFLDIPPNRSLVNVPSSYSVFL